MKPSLSFKLSQSLTLTPQLQQSIRLLQLSATELEQELITAAEENPLIEFESATQQAPVEPIAQLSHLSFDNSKPFHEWNEDDDRLANIRAHSTLLDRLLEQIRTLRIAPSEKALMGIIAGNLNEKGYLMLSHEELCEEALEYIDLEDGSPESQVTRALNRIHHLEPAGIGARNLAECLRLQLEHMPLHDQSQPAWQVAHTICTDYIDIFSTRDWGRLKRILKTSDTILDTAQQLIKSLNPNPAASFEGEPETQLIPDVIVRKNGKSWLVLPNPQAMPKIAVHDEYARIIKENKGHEDSDGIQQKLQEARWLVKNVLQRGETILKVAKAIVDRQENFFNHGAVAMKPLVLREIADTVGMHESTISRVTTQKYMATPLGTFEFKYFFASQISTDSGGSVSSTAIRALIKQLVDNENTAKPLSDTQIMELLADKGFVVARRTIAKYRESLRIPAVHMRRK